MHNRREVMVLEEQGIFVSWTVFIQIVFLGEEIERNCS